MKVKNKTGMGLLILGSILFCLVSGLVHAQENWVTTVNGVGNRNDVGNAVIEGHDGYLYVAGALYRSVNYTDFAVIKIRESTGDTVWVYRYTGSGNHNAAATAICWGDENNSSIYATGHYYAGSAPLANIVVVKLDTAGTQIGIPYKYNNGVGDNADSAFAICYGRGNLFVAGKTDLSATQYAYLILKIDTTLVYKDEFWDDSPSYNDAAALSVVYDGGAYIYSCGYRDDNFYVYKTDTSFAYQWGYYYNGTANSEDRAQQVVYGGDGKIYAAGYTVGSGTGNDFTVVALNNNGTVYWGPYIYDGRAHGDDCAYSVAYQNAGNVYAAGYSTDSTAIGKDFTVIDLSNDLARWIYRYNGIGNTNDLARKIVVSGDYAYAAGYITAATSDVMVAKFDPTHGGVGAANPPYWVYTYDGSSGNTDMAVDIAISKLGTGNLYVTGYSGVIGDYVDLMAMNLPGNFPPTVPVLISPTDSVWLNNPAVTCSWNMSTDPEGNNPITYVLKYDTLANFATADSQVVVTATSKLVTFTDSNAYYYWKVKAKDSGGHQSLYSAVRSFGLDLKPPNSPTLLSPINGVILLDTSVIFTWNSVTFKGPPAPVHYIIQVDTVTSFTLPIKADTTSLTTQHYDLATDYWYYWKVMAYDLAGNQGFYSGYEIFGVDISGPLIDSTTRWNTTPLSGPFGVYAKVTDFSGVDSVLLYYKRMGEPAFFCRKMTEGTFDWYFAEIPKVLLPEDTIKYFIWAMDNNGWISQDPADGYYWFIANHDTGGIQDFTIRPMSFSFGLESNPVKGMALFNLALPQDALITLKIYDVSGRLLNKVSEHKSAGYYQIPWTSDVNPGVYFYTFESSGHKENGKLVIVH